MMLWASQAVDYCSIRVMPVLSARDSNHKYGTALVFPPVGTTSLRQVKRKMNSVHSDGGIGTGGPCFVWRRFATHTHHLKSTANDDDDDAESWG